MTALKSIKNDAIATPFVTEVLPSDAVLVVDGDGYMFYIVSLCWNQFNMASGGNYQIIHETIIRDIQHLTNTLGFELIFYFGGKSDPFKDATMMKRTMQREAKWLNVYTSCRDCVQIDPSELPLPTLTTEQLIQTLTQLKIRIVKCDSESDQIIANEVNVNNEKCSNSRFFCYGRDRYTTINILEFFNFLFFSDFICMKNCPYIELGKIETHTGRSPTKAPVFRRSHTASYLQLSESQLVELSILCGNDFTETFKWSDFSIFPTDSSIDDSNAVDKVVAIRDWLLTQDSCIQLTSDAKDIQISIAYSRAFYNLDDISIFIEQLRSYRLSIGYTVPPVSLSVNMSPIEIDRIERWLKKIGKKNFVKYNSLGSCVIDYLKFSIEKYPTYSLSLNDHNCVITNLQVESFSKMLQCLQLRMGKNLEISNRIENIFAPEWKDVMAGQGYQLLSQFIQRNAEKLFGIRINGNAIEVCSVIFPVIKLLFFIRSLDSTLTAIYFMRL